MEKRPPTTKESTDSNTKTSNTKHIQSNKPPMMPCGIDNYHELITHRNTEDSAYLFVDKTLFIKKFLDAGDKITLITRPRRFGKTLTLSMIQHFLASEVNGRQTKGLFDGLKISQYLETMKKQGQYPVIFLTLKEAKGKSFEEIYGSIKTAIRDLYQVHRYLLSSDKLFSDQKEDFQKILNRQANEDDYKASLNSLSRYLFQHTGKEAYILLDEYDTPINDAYVHGCYEECRSFLASMFGKTFKGNEFLERGLITGILKIAKASLFSELNNLKVYTMYNDARYSQYFGFTEEETNEFLDRAGLSQKAHELKEMYNGYEIEGYTLYNPFSIISFVGELLLIGEDRKEEALKPYWINTGGTHLIGELIKNNLKGLKEDLTSLLDNEAIETYINENVIYNPKLRDDSVGFWSVLLLSGYLKSIHKEKDEFGEENHTICFPNEEIRLSIRKLLLSVSFESQHNQMMLGDMKALAEGDVSQFVQFVKDYLTTSISYFDINDQSEERSYHLLLLGMAAFYANTHHIRSNRESGKGRYDIALEPKINGMKAIIFELKVAGEDQDLKQVAQDAYDQIQTRQYKTDMEARGITDIILLGMAFRGKDVEAVTNVY